MFELEYNKKSGEFYNNLKDRLCKIATSDPSYAKIGRYISEFHADDIHVNEGISLSRLFSLFKKGDDIQKAKVFLVSYAYDLCNSGFCDFVCNEHTTHFKISSSGVIEVYRTKPLFYYSWSCSDITKKLYNELPDASKLYLMLLTQN